MKLCVMSYTLARRTSAPEFDLVRMCEFTRNLGLDGIDVVTTYGRHPREVRRLLDDFGLKPVCYTFCVDINQPDAKAQQAGLDALKREIAAAVTVGADKVMVVTPGSADWPREQSRRNYLRALAAAMPWARAAGLTVTIENFPGASSPFVTAADFALAKKELPELKLTFDCGNCFTGGEDPAASFRACAADVVHAHFKDWAVCAAPDGMLGLDGRHYRGALIGEGAVDHRSVLAAMKEAGYRGYIDIEYEGDAYLPEDATRRAVRHLDTLIAGLA